MTVDVTAEHIKKGKPRSCSRCPVGWAIRGAVPGGVLVNAIPGYISMAGGPFKMPESVVEFVHRFDAGEPVEPISFELPVEQR